MLFLFGTIFFVSDGEPSLKPILRNFRDTEENWPSSSIIAILQRPFGVTITHFLDCAFFLALLFTRDA